MSNRPPDCNLNHALVILSAAKDLYRTYGQILRDAQDDNDFVVSP